MFSAHLLKDGRVIGQYEGYVPEFMPGNHFGDYIELEIDIETGKIINWIKPSDEQLKNTFK
jgi:hypothetical protein